MARSDKTLEDILDVIFYDKPSTQDEIADKLIKNRFPLDYSSYDFKVGTKYDIDSLEPSKFYKEQIQYKIIAHAHIPIVLQYMVKI